MLGEHHPPSTDSSEADGPVHSVKSFKNLNLYTSDIVSSSWQEASLPDMLSCH